MVFGKLAMTKKRKRRRHRGIRPALGPDETSRMRQLQIKNAKQTQGPV
jgi:hypothetical protein